MPRITPAQARTNRLVRQLARRADVAKRTAARNAHRAERHTVASHLRSMGADPAIATGMANAVRKKLSEGVSGYALKDGVRRPCVRYTRAQVLAALVTYKPRKKEFKDFRNIALAA